MNNNIKEKEIIRVKITGIQKYGAFATMENLDYNGLIHISEITQGFVRNVEDYVKMGETIFCKVIAIDTENLKLRLSIKNLEYRNYGNAKKIVESKHGFKPLGDMLPEWTRDKIEELSK